MLEKIETEPWASIVKWSRNEGKRNAFVTFKVATPDPRNQKNLGMVMGTQGH
jgi:hypothetical protein